VAGVALFLLVTGVPTAIAWLQGHEMACRGSPGWQRFAGWFGDCGSYAENSRTTVVINGPVVPQGPVPRKVLYDQNLNQFRLALWDKDEKFLNHLHQTGFRLERDEVCSQLDGVLREVNFDAVAAGKATGTLARFADNGKVRCEDGLPSKSYSVDVYVLKRVIEDSRRRCSSSKNVEQWPKIVAIIDNWISANGKSAELSEEARKYLQALKRAGSAPREDFIKACMVTYALSQAPKFPDAEKGLAAALLQVGGTCFMEHSEAHSLIRNMDTLKSRNSAYYSDPEKGYARTRELEREVCSKAINNTGFNIDSKPFEAALLRWSQ